MKDTGGPITVKWVDRVNQRVGKAIDDFTAVLASLNTAYRVKRGRGQRRNKRNRTPLGDHRAYPML